METGGIVNLHIHSIDQTEAIKTIKRKITDLEDFDFDDYDEDEPDEGDAVSYTHLDVYKRQGLAEPE